MRKILTIALVSLLSLSKAKSQTVFAELGGPGLASINFDTRFSKSPDGFGGRIGVGGFTVNDNSGDKAGVVFIPIGLNYLIGKDEKNYFEIGAGVTPVLGTGDLSGSDFGATFGHVIIGYRMQPKIGGFTFRAFVCPIFGNGVFIPYYGGVSFGYKFSGKK
jgi:hypothetical protein